MKKMLIMQVKSGMEMVMTYKDAKDLAKFSYEKYEIRRKFVEQRVERLAKLKFDINKIIKITDIENVLYYLEDVDWMRWVDRKIIEEHVAENKDEYSDTEEIYILRGLIKDEESKSVISKVAMDYNINQKGKNIAEIIITIEEQKEVGNVEEIIIVKNSTSLKKSEIEEIESGKTVSATMLVIKKIDRMEHGTKQRGEPRVLIKKQ